MAEIGGGSLLAARIAGRTRLRPLPKEDQPSHSYGAARPVGPGVDRLEPAEHSPAVPSSDAPTVFLDLTPSTTPETRSAGAAVAGSTPGRVNATENRSVAGPSTRTAPDAVRALRHCSYPGCL